MPLYEYECRSCRERVEIIQKMTDPPYEICPKCGGDMKKLFSSPAIQFKGSGFYKTDYASGTSSKDSSQKADSKSETKSESKAESASGKSDSGSSSGSSGE